MSSTSGEYYIPSAIDKSVAEVILNQLKDLPLQDATVSSPTGQGDKDLSIRDSKICWLTTDHWISGMMAHFINCANKDHFNYDLFAWSDGIQYTVYDKKDTFYDWHWDHKEATFYGGKDLIRKLSISLCLTSDYTGGELQILKDANRTMESYKMNCGDVLIFPSDLVHRVRKIKTGKRISLVGWYSGPKWK